MGNLIQLVSGFRYDSCPVYNVMKMHSGIDFTAKIGTDISTTGDGVVTSVEDI